MPEPTDLEYLRSRLAHETRLFENSDDISVRIVHSELARQYAAKIKVAEAQQPSMTAPSDGGLRVIGLRDAMAGNHAKKQMMNDHADASDEERLMITEECLTSLRKTMRCLDEELTVLAPDNEAAFAIASAHLQHVMDLIERTVSN